MHRRQRRRRIKNNPRSHPYAAIAGLWSLRILVDLDGWTGLPIHELTSDGGLLRTIGLESLDDEEPNRKVLLQKLKERQAQVEAEKPALDGVLGENLERFGALVGLSSCERRILGFAVLIHSHPGLEVAADSLDGLTSVEAIDAVAEILALPQPEVRQALALSGLLARSGLLKLKREGVSHMTSKLELLDGLGDLLLEPQADIQEMLREFFHPVGACRLAPADFAHLGPHYSLMERHLSRSKQAGRRGVNVLLYGPPGTGKSELAKTLARDIGHRLFEIGMEDVDGDPLTGQCRFSAYRLSQQVLARQEDALILFDEIEDVFPNDLPLFVGRSCTDRGRKAWTNRLLEENPVPAIWISNSIGQIDPAFLRRFDIVFEMKNPPRRVRERILTEQLRKLPVSDGWIRQAAENTELAPALVERAVRVVASMGDAEARSVEADLERVLDGTLTAMGCCAKGFRTNPTAMTYRLDALNPDCDLEQLLAGLKRHPRARLCLYGPPGTGKTEFGAFVSRKLDKPLSVKRASDLLDPYVGMTEKHLADMFEEAGNDDAVLLLDEADSFLQERSGARRSWEITQVNELLTQMEHFDGLFICSTNLVESLDAAALRRFDLKIQFDFLEVEQAWRLFRQVIEDQGTSQRGRQSWKSQLARIENLAPGDFATVVRQNRLSADPLTPPVLLEGLVRESIFKSGRESRGIGFTAAIGKTG